MICLFFQAKADFPENKCAICKQGLDILLIRWDKVRGIKRDTVFPYLSLPRKLKLLGQIAATQFEKGNYYFEKSTLLENISNYLCILRCAEPSDTELQLDSEALLKSIEVDDGLLVERTWEIYSFSHQIFQEYLTAKNFVSNPEPKALETNLTNLVSHLLQPRWREVFLLTVGMLRNGDYLLWLMKQYIDKLIADDQQLQQFICWVHRKSVSLQVSEKPATVRAFYLNQIAQSSEIASDMEMIPDCKIGHNWEFSDRQRETLQQYYHANQLLQYCLNSHLTVTLSVQEEIERTLYSNPNSIPN